MGIDTTPPVQKDSSFTVRFGNGRIADAIHLAAEVIQIHRSTDLSLALGRLGLRGPRPILVLVGGASGISPEDMTRLHSLFVEVLAPLAQSLGAAVVDGGTDSGIMQLMGKARLATHGTFPLIGVAPSGKVAIPDPEAPSPEGTPLEPNHTHFLLVPGAFWGDESSWMADIATQLAEGARSLTVLINGGNVTWRDAAESVRAGRPVLVIAGTGRTADELARAIRGEAVKERLEGIVPTEVTGEALNERAKKLVASGLLQAVDLGEEKRALAEAIEGMLSQEKMQE